MKNQEFNKGCYKSISKEPKNDLKNCETGGQKLSQLHPLQFDVAEICQSRPLELPDYCE